MATKQLQPIDFDARPESNGVRPPMRGNNLLIWQRLDKDYLKSGEAPSFANIAYYAEKLGGLNLDTVRTQIYFYRVWREVATAGQALQPRGAAEPKAKVKAKAKPAAKAKAEPKAKAKPAAKAKAKPAAKAKAEPKAKAKVKNVVSNAAAANGIEDVLA